MMIIATAELKSISPISFSKQHYTEFLEGESKSDYEARTWREKCHYDENRQLYIPAMMLKFALTSTAKYLGDKMKKKDSARERNTKYIEKGVIVPQNIMISAYKDAIEGEWYPCHVSGKRDTGARVPRCFPVVREWEGTATIWILDPQLEAETLELVLEWCGKINGLGRFRPQNQGFYGRFELVSLDYPKATMDEIKGTITTMRGKKK